MADLHEALENAFSEHESKEELAPKAEIAPTAPEIAPNNEENGAKTERQRDEAGKFAKQAPPIDDAPIAPKPPERKAPSSWKPEAQNAWNKADRGEPLTSEEVRTLALEAERREGDFHKGVEEFKTHAQKARAFEQAFAPYRQTLQQLGIHEADAVAGMLASDHKLRSADPATKVQELAKLANYYGINLQHLQSMPQPDPQQQYLIQQINELRQTQQMWQNSMQQREQHEALSLVNGFAEKHEHIDAVRDEMADLLESGKARSLQEAYEKAVWMNPDVRQTLIEQQRVEAQRKAVEQNQHARAKSAAVSVKGSSPSAGGNSSPKGSLREILEASFANN